MVDYPDTFTLSQWKGLSHLGDPDEMFERLTKTTAVCSTPRTDIDPDLLWDILFPLTNYMAKSPANTYNRRVHEELVPFLKIWPFRIADMSKNQISTTHTIARLMAKYNITQILSGSYLTADTIKTYDVYRVRTGEYRRGSVFDLLLSCDRYTAVEYLIRLPVAQIQIHCDNINLLSNLTKYGIDLHVIKVFFDIDAPMDLYHYLGRYKIDLLPYFYDPRATAPSAPLNVFRRIGKRTPAEIYFKKFPQANLCVTGILSSGTICVLSYLPLPKETFHEMAAEIPGLSNLKRNTVDRIITQQD